VRYWEALISVVASSIRCFTACRVLGRFGWDKWIRCFKGVVSQAQIRRIAVFAII
jgi:hypothetical protein